MRGLKAQATQGGDHQFKKIIDKWHVFGVAMVTLVVHAQNMFIMMGNPVVSAIIFIEQKTTEDVQFRRTRILNKMELGNDHTSLTLNIVIWTIFSHKFREQISTVMNR